MAVPGGIIRRVRWSLLVSASSSWSKEGHHRDSQISTGTEALLPLTIWVFWLMGSVHGCLVFGVSRELLEGEGEIQAATRANLNGALPFSSLFLLFVWLVIRCTAVEFAWSRDLHELLFLATCTCVQALSPCSTVPQHPFAGGFVRRGAAVSKSQVLGGRKAAVIKTKCWNKGKTPPGLCSSVGICVFILCADWSSQHDFVKATSSC